MAVRRTIRILKLQDIAGSGRNWGRKPDMIVRASRFNSPAAGNLQPCRCLRESRSIMLQTARRSIGTRRRWARPIYLASLVTALNRPRQR